MVLTEEQLIDRWTTPEGEKRLALVLRALRRHDEDWQRHLLGFVGVDETSGKDLRGCRLPSSFRLPNHVKGPKRWLGYATVDVTSGKALSECWFPAPFHGLWDTRLEYADLTEAHLERANLLRAHMEHANLREAHLEGAELSGAHLERANLFETHMEHALLCRARLGDARPYGAHLEGADLSRAHLERADLTWAHLEGARLVEAHLEYAFLRGAQMKGADLTGAHLEGAALTEFPPEDIAAADLEGADLTGAHLEGADLTGVHLIGVDLSRAHLERANVSLADFTKVLFSGTHFDKTSLDGIRFSPEHPVQYDFSETIVPASRDRLNWSTLRIIGRLPLFGTSWAAFVLSLAVINGANALNRTLANHEVNYSVPVPHRASWTLIGTLLLVVGTSIYRIFCPRTVQAFSEEEWVAAHQQPRLIYFRESWRRRWLQWPTLLFTTSGAAIGIWLIGERVGLAFRQLSRSYPLDIVHVLLLGAIILLVALVLLYGTPLLEPAQHLHRVVQRLRWKLQMQCARLRRRNEEDDEEDEGDVPLQ